MKMHRVFASFILILLGFSAEHALADCQAQFERRWDKAHIIVNALGPDCGHAVLVLTVRDSKNNVLWTGVQRSVDLMNFQDSGKLNSKTMQAELGNWVAEDSHLPNSAALPDWPASVQDGTLPPKAEFPFRVTEGLARQDYLDLRKARLPILCFVGGMESQHCLVLDGEKVTEIGSQAFPG